MTQPIILIQARMRSTRLPDKIIELIGDRRMLDVVIDHVRSTGLKWALAVPEHWYPVKEEDVLGRFAALLQAYDPEGDHYDPILRVTADCPLLDAGQILNVLAQYRLGNIDLVTTSPAWDGLDVEVISRKALARAHALATEPRDREHVTPWLKRQGSWYEIPLDTTLRWSVDDAEGLEFIRTVFAQCPHCADGTPRHSNAGSSIGGADRQPRWDLHMLPAGDLGECTAYDTLKTRMGGPIYVSA